MTVKSWFNFSVSTVDTTYRTFKPSRTEYQPQRAYWKHGFIPHARACAVVTGDRVRFLVRFGTRSTGARDIRIVRVTDSPSSPRTPFSHTLPPPGVPSRPATTGALRRDLFEHVNRFRSDEPTNEYLRCPLTFPAIRSHLTKENVASSGIIRENQWINRLDGQRSLLLWIQRGQRDTLLPPSS